MDQGVVDIVALGEPHLAGALRLSQEAGWPHRIEDWRLTLAQGEGFAALNEAGDVIASSATCDFGGVATVAMVIVAKAARGGGLGRIMTRRAMEAAGSREMRLTATRDGLPLYESLGFLALDRIRQHQAAAPAIARPDNVEPATADDLPAILALDAAATGMDRAKLLRGLADIGEYVVIRRDGAVTGFASRRAFGRGRLVGPVVAATDDDARVLISSAIADCAGEFLRVDTPESTGLSAWLDSIGLPHVGGGVAMARNRTASPPQPASRFKTYALASQALG